MRTNDRKHLGLVFLVAAELQLVAGEKEDREALVACGKGIGKMEGLQERVSRKYDGEHLRFASLVAAVPQQLAGALLSVLHASGGQVVHGPLPPSAEERQVARLPA